MRNTFLALALFSTFFPLWGMTNDSPDPELVNRPVSNLFVHPLIAWPEVAFDRNNSDLARMDEWFITSTEFRRALEALDQAGFVLVRPSDVLGPARGSWTVVSPPIPPGKRPLILSVDDLNYYSYMTASGTISRLKVDNQGQLVAQTKLPNGQYRDDLDREVPQILESYLVDHPDFSFRGARGVIALTGYHGVFGWPTNRNGSEAADQAMKVAAKLKQMGWEFASHSYSHLSSKTQNDQDWLRSELLWESRVRPLIGATSYYVFPFGEAWWKNPTRWKDLTSRGYQVFFAVDNLSTLQWKAGLPILGRVPLDGRTLRRKYAKIDLFFNPKQVWDDLRPIQVEY